jgi:hypothetical protein
MFRLLMVMILMGSIAQAEKAERPKLSPRRSGCEIRLLRDAAKIKTKAKELIRQAEDILDEQLDKGEKPEFNQHAANMVSEAHLLLSELRRMQAGGHGIGLLDRKCEKSIFEKPVVYN